MIIVMHGTNNSNMNKCSFILALPKTYPRGPIYITYTDSDAPYIINTLICASVVK